ncbi:hypothetical protein ACHAPA_010865 [Fusarium lateritium]
MSDTFSTTSGSLKPRMLINGQLVEASDKGTFALVNPATGEQTVLVPEASEDDANRAVAAAKDAFPAWAALDPAERGAYLKKLASLIRDHAGQLALLEAASMGRPVRDYIDAMQASISFDHYAEAWPSIQGQSSLNHPGYVGFTFRQPYGVAAAIIPWNVPLQAFVNKVAPALITGNTVVVKSREKAPLTSARVAELVIEAGFPAGVLNILSGHGLPSGAVLAKHVDVRVLSFTGSGPTGRLIQVMAAQTNLKKVILELGGKSPAIVFEDADIEKAVNATARSIQINSGQVCMANSRIYVQKNIANKFLVTFNEKLAKANLGNPTDPAVDHGPQADERQYQTVLSYIEKGKKTGSLLRGGNGMLDVMGGYFIEPTVFTDTPEDAAIMKEEIFGPVVNINTFQDEEEVIGKANDTEFGLYAAVFTKDISRTMRIAKALQSGFVAVNCSSPTLAEDLPFGGYKVSGQGREGWLHSMNEFLETKTVFVKVEDS